MQIKGYVYRDSWLPNYFPSRPIGERFLRISRHGSIQMLEDDENSELDEIRMRSDLFSKLERTGHIITKGNSIDALDRLKQWHNNSYIGPRLHIFVLTKRCNLSCSYCHMNPEAIGSSSSYFDMNPSIGEKAVDFALSTPADQLTIEFQGGEAFLNYDMMKHIVEYAERESVLKGKTVRFTVVSNLTLVTREHLNYCRQHNISVSYTLNGPPDIHDHYRHTKDNKGSFKAVMAKLNLIRESYSDIASSAPLCVLDSDNASKIIEMIDYFDEIGFKSLSIIKLKHLGQAKVNHSEFSFDRFMQYYLEGVEYLYHKNKTSIHPYSERFVRVALGKILCETDIGYVDWKNPCGDVSGALTYDYDGEILPSDEARSLRTRFSIGNVQTSSYTQLIENSNTFETMNYSLRDRHSECRECTYNPLCGVSPVLEYAKTGSLEAKPHVSEECKFTIKLLDWVFTKWEEDPIPLIRMLPGADEDMLSFLNK